MKCPEVYQIYLDCITVRGLHVVSVGARSCPSGHVRLREATARGSDVLTALSVHTGVVRREQETGAFQVVLVSGP